MKIYSDKQPSNKEIILLCGHGNEKHALWNSESIIFERPDSTKGQSNWMILCEQCYINFSLTDNPPEIRKDSIWKGDEPEFYKIYE